MTRRGGGRKPAWDSPASPRSVAFAVCHLLVGGVLFMPRLKSSQYARLYLPATVRKSGPSVSLARACMCDIVLKIGI